MKRSDIPTDEVLAVTPNAGDGVLDIHALAAERGWPIKILDAWG